MKKSKQLTKSNYLQLGGMFGILSVILVLSQLEPSPSGIGTHTQLGLPPCPLHFFFNLNCPTCGLTTSVVLLLHGELAKGIAAHIGGPFILGGFFISLLILCRQFFQCYWTDMTNSTVGKLHVGASGRAIASLILGIMALIPCCLYFTGIPAIILGRKEMKAIKSGERAEAGYTLAKVGTALGIIGSVFGLFLTILWGSVIAAGYLVDGL